MIYKKLDIDTDLWIGGIKSILTPECLFLHSPFITNFELIDDENFLINYKFTKFGFSKQFMIPFKYKITGNTATYNSGAESEVDFNMQIKLKENGNRTSIEVEASLKAGILADLLGSKMFEEQISTLIRSSIHYIKFGEEYIRDEITGKFNYEVPYYIAYKLQSGDLNNLRRIVASVLSCRADNDYLMSVLKKIPKEYSLSISSNQTASPRRQVIPKEA